MDVLFPEVSENTSFSSQPAIIKVIGVGGGGVNAVNRMIDAKVSDVEFYAVNTDAAQLRFSKADNKIQLGKSGLGVGGDPKQGEECANESIDSLRDIVSGADMVFITTGMGGGTGTGAAPIIAKVAKEAGVLTVAVVTKPFTDEGRIRVENAERGIKAIRQYVDSLIIIPNDRIFTNFDKNTPIDVAFKIVDDSLRHSIEAITNIITKTGEMNVDFSDVKSVLANSEYAVIGLGNGKTVEDAFSKAIVNKFVEGPDIKEANKGIVNVAISNDKQFTVADREFFSNVIKKEFKNHQDIKFGHIFLNCLDEKIKVSIIASFKEEEKPKEDLFDEIEINQKKVEPELISQNDDIISQSTESNKEFENKLFQQLFSKPTYDFWKLKRLK